MSTATLLIAQVNDGFGRLSDGIQIAAVVATLLFLAFVIELVRRRRLVERYALLWISAALVMVALAVWRGGLKVISEAIGVADPVNGIFLIAFALVFSMLLGFSTAFSRLSEETKILAQTVARLDAEIRELRGEGPPPREQDAAENGEEPGPETKRN